MTMQEKLWTPGFIAACAGNFMMFFAFYLLLPILPIYLADTFHAGKSVTGLILASYTVMALLFRPFAGFMVDTFARKPLLLFCYFIFITYFLGYIFAGTLLLFAVIRATHGLAFGMVTVSNNTVAIDIMPSARRGEGIGYFGISTNLATALGPVVSLTLLQYWNNYDYIFLTSYVAGLIGFFCVTRIKTEPRVGVPDKTLSLDRFLLIKGIPGAFNLIFISFAYGILSTYVAMYALEELGLDSGTGLFFVFLALGLIISRFTAGKLLNKGYITRLIFIGILVLAVGLACFIWLHGKHFFYLSAVVIGFAYGFICPAFQTMFINLAPHNQRGTANATYYTSWDLGIGLGALLGGLVAGRYDYTATYILGLVLVIIGGVLFTTVTAAYFDRNKLR